jgi:hypothetical protein
MENLNDKIWYRFLKVVFIITFIMFQFATLFFAFPQKYVYRCNDGKIIPLSHNSTINDSYSFRVDKECDPNVAVPTYDKDGNYTNESMRNYVSNYRGVYVIDYLNSLWFTPLVFLSIWLFFWLISRIFFYVVAKDKFLSGRIVNYFKKEK